jgi:hypothetical protein
MTTLHIFDPNAFAIILMAFVIGLLIARKNWLAPDECPECPHCNRLKREKQAETEKRRRELEQKHAALVSRRRGKKEDLTEDRPDQPPP